MNRWDASASEPEFQDSVSICTSFVVLVFMYAKKQWLVEQYLIDSFLFFNPILNPILNQKDLDKVCVRSKMSNLNAS